MDLNVEQKCLNSSILAGAGLDILPAESSPEDHVRPLLHADRSKEEWLIGRLVTTPHAAWHSPEDLVYICVEGVETMQDVPIDRLHTQM